MLILERQPKRGEWIGDIRFQSPITNPTLSRRLVVTQSWYCCHRGQPTEVDHPESGLRVVVVQWPIDAGAPWPPEVNDD